MLAVSFHTAYLIAALATYATELVAAWSVLRVKKLNVSFGRTAWIVLLANAATHPLLWYIPYLFFPRAFSPGIMDLYTILGEILAFIVEAAIYWLMLTGRKIWVALALSALANAMSLGVGIIAGRFFTVVS